MAQATQRLIERDRNGVTWDVPACQSCVAERAARFPESKHLKRTARGWFGEPTGCVFCIDRAEAEGALIDEVYPEPACIGL